MPVKKIIKVWEDGYIIPKNIEFLQQKTKNVFFPLTENINSIIADLIDTYQKIPCAGVAANQIGYDKSIFIGLKELDESVEVEEIEKKESQSKENIDEANDNAENYEIYINPQIDHTDGRSFQKEIEGCLSIPLLSLRIKRFNKIKVRYYNQEGKSIKKPLSGFMSKLFQHELDHLNGILMLENKIIEGYAAEDSFITAELYEKLQSEIE